MSVNILSPDFVQDTMLNSIGSELSASGMGQSFTMTNLIGGIVFGSIGMIAFMYGKSNTNFKNMGIGIALMAYPYFVSNTFFMILIGIGLTGLLYILRE